MKIINKARGTGKTWDLIKEASKFGGVILTYNNDGKRMLKQQIKDMYYKGHINNQPLVRTIDEINARGVSRELKKKRFYIDELEYMLRGLTGVNVHTATMTGEVVDSVVVEHEKESAIIKMCRNKIVELIQNIDADTDFAVHNHISELMHMIDEFKSNTVEDIVINITNVNAESELDFKRLAEILKRARPQGDR